MRISPSFIILILAALFFQSCKVQSIQPRKIKKLFNESKIVNDHFTGFALYDLDKQQMIYELNDDKYYTPASNTKLFTFFPVNIHLVARRFCSKKCKSHCNFGALVQLCKKATCHLLKLLNIIGTCCLL